ncbi:MAG TPA: hypothetical protein VGN75_15100 [Kaistia sp.]|jgi:hypothetical protein|nr:hypothetical protein [Kaistia sp.]
MAKTDPTQDHHFADYAANEADIPLLVQAALASVDQAGCALLRLIVEPSTSKSAWLIAAYGVRTAAIAAE